MLSPPARQSKYTSRAQRLARNRRRRGGAFLDNVATSLSQASIYPIINLFDRLLGPSKYQTAAAELERQKLTTEHLKSLALIERDASISQHRAELERHRDKRRGEEAALFAQRQKAAQALARYPVAEDAYMGTPAAALQEASSQVSSLMSRYPGVFAQHPGYARLLTDQIVAAMLAPLDTTDPLYLQKTLGELEYQIALEQARLAPMPTAQSLTVARPDITMPTKSLAAWQHGLVKASRAPPSVPDIPPGSSHARRR